MQNSGWLRNRTGTANRNCRHRFSRNRKRNRNRRNRFPGTETGTGTVLSCETVLKHRKTFFAEEPPEPKTGTARTVPPPNRNRTELNRGLPENFPYAKVFHFSKKTFVFHIVIAIFTKGLWMVVSKRWFEFSGGTKFRYPFLPQFNLLLTSIVPLFLPLFNLFFYLNLTSVSSPISNHGWKPRFTDSWFN